MKKRSLLIISFVAAVATGLIYIAAVSANVGDARSETVNRPASVATNSLLVDDFTAPVGTILSSANWSAHSGAGTNSENVVSPGLTYSGYASSGIGNAVSMATSGEDINRQFNILNSGSVYASCMVNVNSATTTGDYFFHFLDGAGFSLLKARLFIKKDGSSSKFAFGIQKSSTANAAYTPFDFDTGTTYLVVIKYTFVAGATNDTVNLFVNPTLPGSEPSPTATATVGTDTDAVDIRGIALRQGSSSNAASLIVDGVRVATSWAGLQAPPVTRPADFDGDGRTDVSVFRDSAGYWFLNRSTAGISEQKFGMPSDKIVPADYDGDGKTDIAVYRASDTQSDADFYILNSNTSTISYYSWGSSSSGDIPIPADYDGDGKAEIAVWRPADGVWWIYNTQTGATSIFQFGLLGDRPFTMDVNGDGKKDLAVFRPSNGYWYFSNATGIPSITFYGYPYAYTTDKIVPGDYDGDGLDDVAVYRPSEGMWYIRRSSDGGISYVQFGTSGDIPVPGDYDGDGITDVGVYRAGVWFVNGSSLGFNVDYYGNATDTPIPAAYLP